MAVHVLCRRVGHNVRAPANRLAVDGRGKGVVHNQRNAVPMRRLSEFLNVQHGQRGIGNRFAEHGARVRAEGAVKLVVRRVGGDESGVNPHLLQRHGNQVERAAVDGGRRDDVAACLANIEQRHKVRCLTGAGQHGCAAALQRRDFRRNVVARRVLQAGIEIAAGLQIEQPAHFGAALVFERGALDDGDLAGFAVFRAVARLYAARTESKLCHGVLLSGVKL